MSGAVLDAGALLAFERQDRRVVGLVARVRERGETISVPAGALGQVWRDGRAQVRLVRLLAWQHTVVVPLDDHAARAAGQLCGATGTWDVIDASVVLVAWQSDALVATSDPGDLRLLDPRLRLLAL